VRARYTCTLARRIQSWVESVPWFAVIVTPDDRLIVVSVRADAAEIEHLERDFHASLANFDEPEELLDYLYQRNSTVTAYSKPITLIAESAEQAARKLIDREREPAA